MNDSDGYLSRDKAYLNRLQRERRARMVRVDYMPSDDALAIMDAKRCRNYPLNTNSGILDAILMEWAELTGKKYSDLLKPKTSETKPGISGPFRARAYDFGAGLPTWAEEWLAKSKEKQSRRRVICGARRHRDGKPCQAKSEPGKKRCKWHGGRSTGPRTPNGKKKALANLRQFRSA